MSFFGFDTSLPPRGGGGKTSAHAGAASNKVDDPFDPTNEQDEDFDDDAAFEEKLRGLTAGAQEDVEIYTWGGGGEGGYDGLGDLLDEAGDDLNDDTFGFGGNDVGKDFDFSGTGGGGAAAAPMASVDSKSGKGKVNDAAFASTMDDFWFMPEVKSSKPAAAAAAAAPAPAAQSAAPTMQQQAAPRSLEEIEAEMRASRQPPAPQAAVNEGRRQLTMEEVEAEMRAKRGQQQQQQPTPTSGTPVDLSAMMNVAAANQTASSVALSQTAFPPLGSQSPQAPVPPSIPTDPNAHLARMRALLEALPPPVQGRILALAPHIQFGAVEAVAREFPALTVAGRVEKLPQQIENPALWPRVDGSPDDLARIRAMIDAALLRLEEADQGERKRQIRMAKINAMSRYNNLMTLSDKDFITRIQVSQLVTNDPYSDDFYAHIFFALRGGGAASAVAGANPGLMGKAPMAGTPAAAGKEATGAGVGAAAAPAKPGRQKKQQTSRRETAMTRMQQQVERIVKNRKERIEKSTQGAALEGALGRVSLSSTKTPRQMLQVGSVRDEKDNAVKHGEEEGAGHAQDAVRQALQGASLQSGAQKKDALTKLEVLSILEKLYDLVLSLEQSRRNAPANANDGQEEEAVQWRKSRDDLCSQLWTELRVLEPLEISDPHPFVSLLSTVKGKRLLPRVLRHLTNEQTLTAMTMIVASFDTLDVVKESVLLDETLSTRNSQGIEKQNDVLRQRDAFATSIVPSMLTLMTTAPMQIVSGMLALFIERNDPVRVAQSKAGIAFLTIFLSRAETLRQQQQQQQQQTVDNKDGDNKPEASDLSQWSEIFNLLIQRLTYSASYLASLFPSTRAKQRLPFGTFIDANRKNFFLEMEDQDVWQLMAALAVSANMNQQQLIVTGLREKILENVLEAKQWKATHSGNSNSTNNEGDLRIRNVNLLLHALNLDAAQITV